MIDCDEIKLDYVSELKAFAKSRGIPLNLTFELTPFCNFRCVMCYVRLDKNEAEKRGRLLPADKWLEIARQARESGTLYISLTGGEPFMHPEFWRIYSELNKMGFIVSILSNGSFIDETAIENFRLYGMPATVKLTVYGASDETYKRVCDSSDGFTKISRAVDLLKAEGVPLKLTSTIVRENACDLQEIYAFARKKGLSMQHTVTVLRSSRGAVNSVEESRFKLSEFTEELTLEALEKSKFPPLKTPFAWCGGYMSSGYVTWHGKLQLCSFLSKPRVNYSGNFSDDFKKLNKLLFAVKNPSECDECSFSEFCQRCPGTLCAESGHPEKIDSDFCEMARCMQDLYRKKKKENGYEK